MAKKQAQKTTVEEIASLKRAVAELQKHRAAECRRADAAEGALADVCKHRDRLLKNFELLTQDRDQERNRADENKKVMNDVAEQRDELLKQVKSLKEQLLSTQEEVVVAEHQFGAADRERKTLEGQKTRLLQLLNEREQSIAAAATALEGRTAELQICRQQREADSAAAQMEFIKFQAMRTNLANALATAGQLLYESRVSNSDMDG